MREQPEIPQEPLLPVEHSDRRLSSEPLANAARSASLDHARAAIKPVGRACEKDVVQTCADDWRLIHEVIRYTNGDMVAPLTVEAYRNLHVCLATKSDALSPSCLATLVKAYLETPPALPDAAVGGDHPSPNDDTVHNRQGRHNMRRQRGGDDEKESSDDVARAPGTIIYLTNNNGGGGMGPTGGAMIGNWKEGEHHGDHHGRRHNADGMHPFVWLAVLPFFCVGVVVSMRRAISIYRQRRANCEYTPLATKDASRDS